MFGQETVPAINANIAAHLSRPRDPPDSPRPAPFAARELIQITGSARKQRSASKQLTEILNGGSTRGYQDFFAPLAERQSPVATRLQPRLAVCLYIAMLGVNVLNCRGPGESAGK